MSRWFCVTSLTRVYEVHYGNKTKNFIFNENIGAVHGRGTPSYNKAAHRTTLTKDIAALQEFGMDIVTVHSTQCKYFVGSRNFELPEMKL